MSKYKIYEIEYISHDDDGNPLLDKDGNHVFCPKKRASQKQYFRDYDDFCLGHGFKSKEEIQKQNSFFGCLDLKNAKIIRHKKI